MWGKVKMSMRITRFWFMCPSFSVMSMITGGMFERDCVCAILAAIAESKHFFISFISHALKCQNIIDGGRLLFVNMYLMCLMCVCVLCVHVHTWNVCSSTMINRRIMNVQNMWPEKTCRSTYFAISLLYYYFFFCARIFLSGHFPEGTFENWQHAIACMSMFVYISQSVLHRTAEAAAAHADTATAHPTENCVWYFVWITSVCDHNYNAACEAVCAVHCATLARSHY